MNSTQTCSGYASLFASMLQTFDTMRNSPHTTYRALITPFRLILPKDCLRWPGATLTGPFTH